MKANRQDQENHNVETENRAQEHRIRARGDGRCLGGFLSLWIWWLVILMMVAGRLLRGTLAHVVVGPLYLAIGTALLVSSRVTWRSWRESCRCR